MYPCLFKEEFGSVLYCDTFLAGFQYSHLIKFFHDQKYTVITMLGRREARQIVHGDGLSGLARIRQRSVQGLLIDR